MRQPVEAIVDVEMFFRATWELELRQVLHKLEREVEDLGLQVHQNLLVVYEPYRELVHIYPKHYDSSDAFVPATPNKARDSFLLQRSKYYYP